MSVATLTFSHSAVPIEHSPVTGPASSELHPHILAPGYSNAPLELHYRTGVHLRGLIVKWVWSHNRWVWSSVYSLRLDSFDLKLFTSSSSNTLASIINVFCCFSSCNEGSVIN